MFLCKHSLLGPQKQHFSSFLEQMKAFRAIKAADVRIILPPSETVLIQRISLSPSSLIAQMLQRDPKKRATLDEIGRNEWLQGVDPSPATKLSTPLVSHRSLSEEEHGSIIQRMVLGGIADRDAVTE